jgi:hypothetical protein
VECSVCAANFSTAPKQQWVSLTDDEIEDILGESVELLYSGNFKAIRAIEAKLKERNDVS